MVELLTYVPEVDKDEALRSVNELAIKLGGAAAFAHPLAKPGPG